MSTYTPIYGITESMEASVVKSTVMIRLHPYDIVNHAIQKPLVTIIDPKFVEFADNGDLIFKATLIKPVESVLT